MITFLLLCILLIQWADFYIRNEKLIKKLSRKKVWEFSINKKWVGDKIKEELSKNNF